MNSDFTIGLGIVLAIVVPIICGIVLLVSIAMLFSSSEQTKKTARRLLLGSIITAIVCFIIGFSICTMGFGSFK
jgi:uncharacterized BrkB/YihY/UPF0761 family membrane protein